MTVPISHPAPRAAIVGISGPRVSAAETALFCAFPPTGVILFSRNITDPAQLADLTASLHACLPTEAVILVDQEGGRVARLKPPRWRAHPPAGAIGALHARDRALGLRAAYLTGALIGSDCAEAGIDVVCAPMLDVRQSGADNIVGDRAYSEDAEAVAELAARMIEGLLEAGVQPVGKHAPGHGRAMADSHLALPRIDAADLSTDLLPFRRNAGRLPWMMTAHIVYAALDPDAPATLSAPVISRVIRGEIGFAGLLTSDDLAMGALDGPPEERAGHAIAAGCDVAMYCPGDPEGNAAVLRTVPPMTVAAMERLARGAALARNTRSALDVSALASERDEILR